MSPNLFGGVTITYKTFAGPVGIETEGVERMADLGVYLSGPMMSSTESSGERSQRQGCGECNGDRDHVVVQRMHIPRGVT
jgi:hypothetical protein